MKNHHHISNFSLFLILVLLCSGLVGCGNASTSNPVQKTGTYFDTVISVTIYDASKTQVLEECFALADEYERLLSTTREDSEISAINSAQGKPVIVSDETLGVLEKALEYAEISEGRFDPTVGRLSKLWQEAMAEGKLPEEASIQEALLHMDYKKVQIEGNKVTLLDSEMELDLGGIAKGYIADRMRELLLESGVKSAMINLGGNVLTIGEKPDGSAYTIGLQKPFSTSGEVSASVEVRDSSVVTSGDYERYLEVDGEIYHHIIDLSTGYPVQNDIHAVTVITEDSVDGDALSTILFLMGEEEGLSFIEAHENMEAAYLRKDGTYVTSSGMEQYHFTKR